MRIFHIDYTAESCLELGRPLLSRPSAERIASSLITSHANHHAHYWDARIFTCTTAVV